MATPQSSTPLHPHHPTSASKKSNNAHTPAGPASAPRSVPSPAAIRGANTGRDTKGGVKMGGTPMAMSLSSHGVSPGFLTGSGFTPNMAGLPVSGYTPGSSSGTMMMPSMSDLGISSKPRGDSEFERRRKMKTVLKSIGRRHARVSEEGIARASRRVGLANDIDAEGEEVKRKLEGERPIGIAGRDVIVDVEMRGNVCRGVVVAGMGGVSEGEMKKAGKVLGGLLMKGEDLGGFGRELGRVAGLDRIGERGVSAFQAVSGVGGCLERLYEKECEQASERDVLRKRSGRPWMHARGRIGLGVDYWTTVPPTAPKDADSMDLDTKDDDEDPADFHTLHITAESCPASMYPPVRVSTDWLADIDASKTDDNTSSDSSQLQIPWQDPPPTYTSPPDDPMEGETTTVPGTKLPDMRFLATLSPPLILPYQTASQILAELGGDVMQGMLVKEWHEMLRSEATKDQDDNASPSIHGQTTKLGAMGGTALVEGRDGEDVKYEWEVNVTKAEWGYRLEDLPFAHPRQVVGLLPVLRQWGVFGELVGGVLSTGSRDCESGAEKQDRGEDVDTQLERELLGDNTVAKVEVEKVPTTQEMKGGEDTDLLDDLLLENMALSPAPPSPPAFFPASAEADVKVTVEISTSPQPTLAVGFPLKEGGMGRVVVQVGRNADVVCSLFEGFGEGTEGVAERLAKGLEVCGDVGVWVEWIRGGGWKMKG